MGRTWAVVIAAVALSTAASADPAASDMRTYVVTPHDAFVPRLPGAQISPYIYLNRCTNGCIVHGSSSTNDARTQTSTIPAGAGPFTVGEFANGFAQTGTSGKGTCLGPDGSASTTTCTSDAGCASLGAGALCDTADYEWNLLVKCMKEVYSPYNVMLQDAPPSGGVSYTEAMIAGVPAEIGLSGVGGIAPLAVDCSAQDDVISFSFANEYGGYGQGRVYAICWTAAQETAHAFGLDHEYQFVDGSFPQNDHSACMDPMTYRTDCGGEKFFRNGAAQCGEYQGRNCLCGGTQNPHERLLNVFGAGTPITAPPTIQIDSPMAGATIAASSAVVVDGGAQRGIARIDLSLNGYVWATTAGAAFGANGQPYGQQPIVLPSGVPNSIIDVVAKAYDDLGSETDSATVTFTLGAPCTDASACAKGQLCQAGKCFWNPPTGELGASCTYDQFCVSNICVSTSSGSVCTQQCLLGTTDSCPAGFDCVMANDPVNGYCIAHGKGGGCSAGGDSPAVPFALAVGVLGVALRRRHRM